MLPAPRCPPTPTDTGTHAPQPQARKDKSTQQRSFKKEKDTDVYIYREESFENIYISLDQIVSNHAQITWLNSKWQTEKKKMLDLNLFSSGQTQGSSSFQRGGFPAESNKNEVGLNPQPAETKKSICEISVIPRLNQPECWRHSIKGVKVGNVEGSNVYDKNSGSNQIRRGGSWGLAPSYFHNKFRNCLMNQSSNWLSQNSLLRPDVRTVCFTFCRCERETEQATSL